jgi:hypothetical protein
VNLENFSTPDTKFSPTLFSYFENLLYKMRSCSTEVNNEWSYTSSPSVYQHGIDRCSFTLTVDPYDETVDSTARGNSVVGPSDCYSGGPGFNFRSFYLY